jgi:hypothetical protein
MPFAGGLQELCDRALFAARIGEIASDDDPVISADIEAEVWVPDVLHALTKQVSEDPERRHLLQARNSVPLDSGVGALTDAMMTEYIETGGVRDADGNVLVRVHNYDDFLKYLPSVYGYYCLQNNQIYTRALGSGSMFDTSGPLEIDCPRVPTALTIPEELEDDAVTMLAARIRYGVLAPTRVASG